MATRITPEQKKEINELYLVYKTYAGVAKKMGIAPTTVKKYIIPNYISQAEIKPVQIDGQEMRLRLETFSLTKEQLEDSLILTLTDDEKEEIKKLWEELVI